MRMYLTKEEVTKSWQEAMVAEYNVKLVKPSRLTRLLVWLRLKKKPETTFLITKTRK